MFVCVSMCVSVHVYVHVHVHVCVSLQLLMWINQNFLLNEDVTGEGDVTVAFMSLRGSGPLIFKMSQTGQVRCDPCAQRSEVVYMSEEL